MIVGLPKEIKEQENRVGLTPAGVNGLVNAGHTVYVEKSAGLGSSFADAEYEAQGAIMLDSAEEVWAKAEMIVKVKEPLESEYKYFREGLIIFTYLHLAAFPELTKALVDAGTIGIAYETVELTGHKLPLLAPMSGIAGRMAIQHAAIFLETIRGGQGLLIDGVPGVKPAEVVIVGAGNVGTAALRRAVGLGCRVTILDINLDRLTYLDDVYNGRIETVYSNNYNLMEACKTADVVVGAVLIPGAKAPKLITEEIVKAMKPGSVIVDIAIDQGGSVETVDAPTTHQDPIFVKHDVIHYAVANVPGAVSKTGTLALTNATFRYTMALANKGWKKALQDDPALAKGANTINGKVTYEAVAHDLGYDYVPVSEFLEEEFATI